MDPPNIAAPALELTAWILPGTVAVSELIDQGRGSFPGVAQGSGQVSRAAITLAPNTS